MAVNSPTEVNKEMDTVDLRLPQKRYIFLLEIKKGM